MEIRKAKIGDIEGILELHSKYHIDTISEKDKSDGFVTTAFTKDELTKLITQEHGVSIAVENNVVVAYVMAASWDYWSKWPMFKHMINELSSITYKGHQLTTENSYQYGPVCLDKSVRNSGLLEKIFSFSYNEISSRFPILVTFVNKNNQRSYQAHSRKLGLDTVLEFSYNKNEYYEMVFTENSNK